MNQRELMQEMFTRLSSAALPVNIQEVSVSQDTITGENLVLSLTVSENGERYRKQIAISMYEVIMSEMSLLDYTIQKCLAAFNTDVRKE